MIERTVQVELTEEDEIGILRKYAKKHPEVLKVLLKHPKGHCPFPGSCKVFPCKTLDCNADCCSNGYAYRQS